MLSKEIERHVVHRGLDSKTGETVLNELWNKASSGFPYYGVSPVVIYGIIILLIMGVVAYSIAGKGVGSHAGREEVRRSYRRQLAREMAKQDAQKIREGTKPRRKWMQW